jgi:hypothetical protein
MANNVQTPSIDMFGPEPVGSRTLFERLPDGYVFELVDDSVRIEFRHLRRDWRQMHAEVDVRCAWAGVRHYKGSLSCADLNLSSQTARTGLATHLGKRAKTKADEFDWAGAIDAACLEVIQAEREGSTVIVLDDAPDAAEAGVDVFGLHVPTDAASLLIAHGDSLKSLLLLVTLGTLAQRGHRVLYLDYEWTAAKHRGRKQRLFGTERLENLRYLRCHAPLVVEVDAIRRYCAEHAIGFVGVDSVGLACDGKLSDDDTAIRFHRALGHLPPSMCAAHVPKSSLGPDVRGDAIGPFGSVFFSNLCRASWLVKKQPGSTDDVVTVGCFPQKQNDGARHRPAGVQFQFSPDRIDVQAVDLATVEGLADRLTVSTRMAHVLKAGPLTYLQIANALDVKQDTVIKAASRSKTFKKVSGTDNVTRIALVDREHVA